MFQLKTSWDEASEQEKELCIDKATEACNLVRDVIAPKAGSELFQSCVTSEKRLTTQWPCTAGGGLQ